MFVDFQKIVCANIGHQIEHIQNKKISILLFNNAFNTRYDDMSYNFSHIVHHYYGLIIDIWIRSEF